MSGEHKAIEPVMVGATQPHKPMTADPQKSCVACGRYHGSVGVGTHCLELEVIRLRRLLAARPPR